MKEKAITFFVNPLVPAVLTTVAPFFVALIAVRKDHIVYVFNHQLPMPDDAVFGGVGDLIGAFFLLGILVAGFALHKWAEAKVNKARIDALGQYSDEIKTTLNKQASENKAQIDELGKHSKELEKLIKTLPPEGFLKKYNDLLNVSYEFVASALEPTTTPKSSELAIKAILQNLAHLAAYFDGIHGNARYAVNVMVFEDFATIDRVRSDSLFEKAMFKETGMNKQTLKGVLTIDRRFAFTLGQQIVSDSGMPQLILPIPSDGYLTDHAFRSMVLPGAPEAFCKNEHKYCDDTASLGNSCRKTGLRKEIAEKMDTYFQTQGQNIKSFLSLPIYIPSNNEIIRVGIVNIHLNLKGMLRGTDGAKLFVPLSAPYCFILAQLLRSQPAPLLDISDEN